MFDKKNSKYYLKTLEQIQLKIIIQYPDFLTNLIQNDIQYQFDRMFVH